MKGLAIDTVKLSRASDRLKAIAHPLRLKIVCFVESGPKSVSQIQQCLGCEQAIVSQQLRILKDKGVLSSKKEGTSNLYFLKFPAISGIIKCLEECDSC